MLFNHLKYKEVVWMGTRVSMFLMAVLDVLPGILEVLLDLRLPHIFPGNRHRTTSADLSKTTTSSAFKKYTGVFAQICVAPCVAWRPRSEP